jgi:uncharacterized protein YjbI with pentapeptide repeats
VWVACPACTKRNESDAPPSDADAGIDSGRRSNPRDTQGADSGSMPRPDAGALADGAVDFDAGSDVLTDGRVSDPAVVDPPLTDAGPGIGPFVRDPSCGSPYQPPAPGTHAPREIDVCGGSGPGGAYGRNDLVCTLLAGADECASGALRMSAFRESEHDHLAPTAIGETIACAAEPDVCSAAGAQPVLAGSLIQCAFPGSDQRARQTEVTTLCGSDLSGANFSSVVVDGCFDCGRLDLRCADLSQANFSGANLDFFNVQLASAKLAGANLTDAVMRRASLTGVDLAGADLTRTDLTDAMLLGADLSGATLAGTKLDGADLTDADLAGVDLSGTSLAGAGAVHLTACPSGLPAGLACLPIGESPCARAATGYFLLGPGAMVRGANLRGQDFSGFDLSGVHFEASALNAARFDGANLTGTALTNANLRRATLHNAVAVDTVFSDADLSGADFSGADLTDATFSGADVTQAKFRGADLTRVSFLYANMDGVDLSGMSLPGVWLADLDACPAKLPDETWRCEPHDHGGGPAKFVVLGPGVKVRSIVDAYARINLRGRDLRDLKLRGAQLDQVSFRDADLSNADFGGADLYRVDFTGANLCGATLAGAQMRESWGSGLQACPAVLPEGWSCMEQPESGLTLVQQ